MRIEGDSSGGLVEFSAWEARVGELAHIVDAAVLERELASAVRFAPTSPSSTPTMSRRRSPHCARARLRARTKRSA